MLAGREVGLLGRLGEDPGRVLDADPDHACGGGPIVSVMRACRTLGARRAHVLCRADSGDVSGDRSSVVGYLAAAFTM